MSELAPGLEEKDVAERTASQRIVRNAGFRTVGELVAKLGTLAVFVLLARELGTSEFGQFSFALSLASVLVIGSALGTADLLAREVARDHAAMAWLLDDVVVLQAVMSLCVLIAVGTVLWLTGGSATSLEVFALVGAGTLLDNLQRTWHSVFLAFEHVEYTSAALIVQRAATALGTAAVLALGGDVVAASAMFFAGSLTGLLVAEVFLRTRIGRPPRRVRPATWPGLLRAGFPIGLLTLMFVILLRLDVSLVGLLRDDDGPRQVGLYGAAFRLFEATMFLTWAFAGAVVPWLSRSAKDAPSDVPEGLRLAHKALLAALAPIAVVLAVFADSLIGLLYGAAYEDAVPSLRILAVVVVCYGFNELTAMLLISHDQPRRFLVALPPVIALNVGLNIVLVPEYGAVGAAWASAASGLVLVAVAVWQTHQLVGRVRWGAACGGPLVAAAAMAATGLLLPAPFVPAAALALVVYAAVLVGYESAFHRLDVHRVRDALRRRVAPVVQAAGSG